MCEQEKDTTPVYIQVGERRTKVHALDLCDKHYEVVAELLTHAHLKQHRIGDTVKIEPPKAARSRK